MITSPQEYNSLLHALVDPSKYVQYLQIPTDEQVYKIDLNERKAEAPSFISVTEDHNAEILWFSVDRFYDSYDLYNTTCWIQYVNADGDGFYYAAPLLIKGETYGPDTLLIPWIVSKEVGAASGNIQFAFQFFTLSEDGLSFKYLLNTVPSTTKVLSGLIIDDPEHDAKQQFAADTLHAIEERLRVLEGLYSLNWTDDYN